jgi:tetratricopeptide (TPR) repeat protein
MSSTEIGFAAPQPLPRPVESSWRRRWQLPTFISGLLAMAVVALARPLMHRPNSPGLEERIAEVRRTLEPGHAQAGRALLLAQHILEHDDVDPSRVGEIQFLIGSSYLELADETAAEPNSDLWAKARHHLEQAAILHVTAEDQPRLLFRLGKALFHCGADAQVIIDYLSPSISEGADDPAEGYEMLTQAYLRLPQPNTRAALEANQKQLALSTANDESLAPARLLRGELLLGLCEAEEARQVLSRIHHDAPATIYARARYLLAESFQHDQLWPDATRIWEEILKDSAHLSGEPGRVLYYLGVCYAQLDRIKEAAATWDKALRYDPESGQAAALALADIRLTSDNPAEALEYFERAVRGLKSPETYHNSLLSLADARAIFEKAGRFYLKAGQYECAERLARSYAAICLPGGDQELLAHAAEQWAERSINQSQEPGRADSERLRQGAAAHRRQAAVAYQNIARLQADKSEQARWLRLSVERYLQAEAYHEATEGLQTLLRVETEPEQIGNAWFLLAEADRALKREPAARSAYLKCLEFPNRSAFRARLKLAQADIADGKFDDAEASLKQNLDLMRANPDEEAYERSLQALADLLFRRGNYRQAANYFQEALERFPGNGRAAEARLELAQCYRQLAAQEDQKLRAGAYMTEEAQVHYRQQRRRWMQMASAHYQKLTDDLTARFDDKPLGEKQETILRQAGFALAECHFELGDFTGAVQLFEQLVTRNAHEPDALRALKQITRCHWIMRNHKAAQETVARIKTLLPTIPDAAFHASPELGTRQEWLEWVDWAAKQ